MVVVSVFTLINGVGQAWFTLAAEFETGSLHFNSVRQLSSDTTEALLTRVLVSDGKLLI